MLCCTAALAVITAPALGGRLAGAARPLLFGLIAGTAMLVPIDGHGAADRAPHRFWCGAVR